MTTRKTAKLFAFFFTDQLNVNIHVLKLHAVTCTAIGKCSLLRILVVTQDSDNQTHKTFAKYHAGFHSGWGGRRKHLPLFL